MVATSAMCERVKVGFSLVISRHDDGSAMPLLSLLMSLHGSLYHIDFVFLMDLFFFESDET